MIGLEYILQEFNMQHKELSELLGIDISNVNYWTEGKNRIPYEYLMRLNQIFGIPVEYFQRELWEID